MGSNDTNIVKSPYKSLIKSTPDVSITDFLFESLDMNYELLQDQIWVQDTLDGSFYKFKDIKPMTRKIASGLTRLGFKKGDVLCFATTNVDLIYLVQLSVWICGGALRGLHPNDTKEDYEREVKEVRGRFMLFDTKTCSKMKWASQQLGWDVQVVSIGGGVEDATAIEDMIANDDCSFYPHDVQINTKEDICMIVPTNGSTGPPKAVTHTHHSMVALYSSFGAPNKITESREVGRIALSMAGNHLISAYCGVTASILYGFSLLSNSQFDLKTLHSMIAKYKPESVLLYPYAANIFIQSDDLYKYDLTSVKYVFSGGSVFTVATAKLFASKLPQVKLMMLYGMSEILITTFSSVVKNENISSERKISGIVIGTSNGREYISCGKVLPSCEAKIVDPIKRCDLGRNKRGILWMKCPYMMKGYLDPKSAKGHVLKLEEDGWFDTGDIGYFDENDNLYILDRARFTFMYKNKLVCPSEIEDIIMRNSGVSIAGVIGVDHPIHTTCARAYIVLKPNYKITEEEMINYVAERADDHMQLHGGVVFLDELPESRGGKINRAELYNMAKREMNGA
ncbi:luciferin 4-monooxygenase-like [Ischnura elegans]|uniref:luciferin 4-monooxygenase-like n=1 Tax=Ischnura elegans TaxID=197161 RepID=UPI001ED86758|nr:luciferin 4-monooxygenase-like [Ischnura elegans]XP_046395282.1 luciferin 4-monooxygenase-like [Ischnura elegans]XP_046395283.1 luciferin 4-monooxygenase-like [Ischnura elegans]